MNAKQVADTIIQQLGHGALFLIGAKRLVAVVVNGAPGLRFSMMRCRGNGIACMNYAQILLDEITDTYTVSFGYQTVKSDKVVASFDDIYCDQLHSLIEDVTGLVTGMPMERRA